MDFPPQAKRVKKFVPPPREIPSELIGKTTTSFAFADLAGSTISSDSLGDRIKVLLWFNDHPACRSSVQQLNQVYQQFKAQPRVAIYAVCTEPATVSDGQVGQLLQLWQVDLPAVRDVQAFGRDLFQIPWAPTMVVLDGNNVLHIFEVGANPNLVAELPQVLERLAAGENLAGEILEQFRQARTKYAQASSVVSRTHRLPRPTRHRWRLRRRHTCCVCALPGPAKTCRRPAISWRSTMGRTIPHFWFTTVGTRLWNSAAKVVSPLDTNSICPKWRPSASCNRLGMAGSSATMWPGHCAALQAHVFDTQWHRVLSYPPSSVRHDGVQDALLADLDANGSLELCVGFWGTAGVHCVSLEGAVLWTNNQVSHVFSLAAAQQPGNPCALWVASASGQVIPLDQHGQAGQLANQTGQLIHHVFSAGDPLCGTAPYCGIAYGTDGRRLALGLTPEPRSQWRYDLPAGSFPSQIRFVAAATLLSAQQWQWLIAGPEGSLHIISQDGMFTDSFLTGSSLAGLAGGQHNNQGILVISTGDGVRAWEVSPPETAALQ